MYVAWGNFCQDSPIGMLFGGFLLPKSKQKRSKKHSFGGISNITCVFFEMFLMLNGGVC